MENVMNKTAWVNYEKHYTDSKLVDKLKKTAQKAGLKAIYAVLLLFYVLVDGSISIKDRSLIIGSLGYFILPLDLVPDWILALGYTDDMAVLLFVIGKVRKNITPQIKAQARKKLWEYFKITDENLLNEIC